MQQGRGQRGAAPAPATDGGRDLGGTALLAACGAGAQTGTGSTQAGQSGGSRPLPAATVGWDTFRGFTPGHGVAPDDGGVLPGEAPQRQDRRPGDRPGRREPAERLPQDAGHGCRPAPWARCTPGTPLHWQLYQAVRRNIIRPIDELITRDKFDLKQYYAPSSSTRSGRARPGAFPSWGWTGQDGILYNTELAQQAGVTFPAQTPPTGR